MKTEKTDIRAKLAELNAKHKELDTLSSDHWAKKSAKTDKNGLQ